MWVPRHQMGACATFVFAPWAVVAQGWGSKGRCVLPGNATGQGQCEALKLLCQNWVFSTRKVSPSCKGKSTSDSDDSVNDESACPHGNVLSGQVRAVLRLILPPKATEQPAGWFLFWPAPLFNLDLRRKHMECIEKNIVVLSTDLVSLSLEKGPEILNICRSLAPADLLGWVLTPWTRA